MTLSTATPFPFRHDWNEPFTVTRSWATDVQRADDGTEVRVAVQTAPAFRVSTLVRYLDERAFGNLMATWQSAAQPGYVEVPIWSDAAPLIVQAFAGDGSVQADPTNRRFFTVGGRVMLWRDFEHYEVFDIGGLATGAVIFGTGQTLANGYADSITYAVPLRRMWLAADQQATWLAPRLGEATFEFEDVAPGVTGASSATAATVASVTAYGTNPASRYPAGDLFYWPGYQAFFTAMALDAAGVPIPGQRFSWVADDPVNVIVVPNIQTDRAVISVNTPSITGVTVTCGAQSHHFRVN